jgi:hypothetical protein
MNTVYILTELNRSEKAGKSLNRFAKYPFSTRELLAIVIVRGT